MMENKSHTIPEFRREILEGVRSLIEVKLCIFRGLVDVLKVPTFLNLNGIYIGERQ